MRCQKVGKYLKKSAFRKEMEEGKIFGVCVFFDFSLSRMIILTYLCCVAMLSLVREV